MRERKYLMSFSTLSEYNDYIYGENFVLPNVSWVEDAKLVKFGPSESSILCVYDVTGSTNTSIKLLTTTANIESISVDNGGYRAPQNNWTFSPGKHTVEFKLINKRVFSSSLFSGCTELFSIIINAPIESIAKNGFNGCKSLQHIVMPNSVTVINSQAFTGCANLASIKLPENLLTIGANAFQNCILTEITIPESVSSIGNAAFSTCKQLTSVVFEGNNIITIGQQTFQNCTALQSIVFPSSVQTYGNQVLMGCSKLSSVDFGESVSAFGNRILANTVVSTMRGNVVNYEGNAVIIGTTLYAIAPTLTTFETPTSVTTIATYALGYCKKITSLKINSAISSLAANALYGCSVLKTINAYPTTAPTIANTTFNSVNKNGVLHHKAGSDYSTWMNTASSYLGYLTWTEQSDL